MKRPNLLFLFADQHSARTLGCYGNADVRTPHLDNLALQGVRLENAYCNNPICTPSRISFLSGQYCHNHGYYGLMGPEPSRLPSLFRHFRRHGYRTGMAGKIHTPSGWLSRDCDFVADGYGHETRLTPANAHLLAGQQGMWNDAYTRHLEINNLAHLRDDRFLPETLERDPTKRGVQGFDARPSRLPADETIEAWCAAQTISFVEETQRAGQPFCFWMTMPHPHSVYAPAQPFWDLYDGPTLPLPPNADDALDGRYHAARTTQRRFRETTDWMLFEPRTWEAARRRVLHGYYGCVSQMDDAVGRVLASLDRLGLRENTLVVYSTDHGEFAGEHGIVEKAPGIGFRCVTRIPQIWSWPGVLPENAVRQSLVESVDFLPTASALCGLPPPDSADGVDLRSLLESDTPLKSCAVTENALAKTIHTSRFKLTQYLPEQNDGSDFGELFDVENDPWELANLYFDPAYREVANALRRQLYDWMVRTRRNVTETPSAPPPLEGQSGNPLSPLRDWDLADDLRGEDGKLRPGVRAALLARKRHNYL